MASVDSGNKLSGRFGEPRGRCTQSVCSLQSLSTDQLEDGGRSGVGGPRQGTGGRAPIRKSGLPGLAAGSVLELVERPAHAPRGTASSAASSDECRGPRHPFQDGSLSERLVGNVDTGPGVPEAQSRGFCGRWLETVMYWHEIINLNLWLPLPWLFWRPGIGTQES